MTILSTLLEELTEEAIEEVLRKFNFAKFKTLGSPNLRIEYAQQNLPEMGYGSSRAVFALSGGKVLKIAINQAGYAQNRAEYEIFRDPRTKNAITAIFDKDPTFSWLVSEIANPLRSSDQFQQLTGVAFSVYVDIIKAWDESEDSSPDIFFQEIVHKWQDRLEEIEMEHASRQIYIITQKRLEHYKKAAQSPFVRTMMMLVKESLSVGDVARIETGSNTIGHYGYTVDGRVVLLDYGFTREVAGKHYSASGHPIEHDPEVPAPEEQPQSQPGGLAGQQSQPNPPPPPPPPPSQQLAQPQANSVKTVPRVRRA